MGERITSMPEADKPTPRQQAALDALAEAKAGGEEMNSAKVVIDRAVDVIKGVITAALQGIASGVCGEPTGEDLQRLHELKSLLDDLP